MDPLHLCLALGSLAAYLLVIGLVNLSRRPRVTSGGRDLAALCLVGLCGFVIAGPMELFLPEAAANRFGLVVWPVLLVLYVLLVTFLVLMTRPRLVIYNITVDQLRPILADLVAELDGDARWAGDSLSLPQLGVQLHIESSGAMRNVQLVASGPVQNYAGWWRLEKALVAALRQTRSPIHPLGIGLVLLGLVIFGGILAWTTLQPEQIAEAVREMLRL